MFLSTHELSCQFRLRANTVRFCVNVSANTMGAASQEMVKEPPETLSSMRGFRFIRFWHLPGEKIYLGAQKKIPFPILKSQTSFSNFLMVFLPDARSIPLRVWLRSLLATKPWASFGLCADHVHFTKVSWAGDARAQPSWHGPRGHVHLHPRGHPAEHAGTPAIGVRASGRSLRDPLLSLR